MFFPPNRPSIRFHLLDNSRQRISIHRHSGTELFGFRSRRHAQVLSQDRFLAATRRGSRAVYRCDKYTRECASMWGRCFHEELTKNRRSRETGLCANFFLPRLILVESCSLGRRNANSVWITESDYSGQTEISKFLLRETARRGFRNKESFLAECLWHVIVLRVSRTDRSTFRKEKRQPENGNRGFVRVREFARLTWRK